MHDDARTTAALAAGEASRAVVAAALEVGAAVRVATALDSAALAELLAHGAEVVVLGPGAGPGAAEVAALCREHGAAWVRFADAWSEGEAQAAFDAGAADFVSADQLARLGPVVARAGARVREQRGADFVRRVVDALPFVVFAKDGDELRMRLVNGTGAAVFQTTESVLLGKRDEELFPPEQAASFIAMDREVLATGNSVSRDETVRNNGVDRIFRTRKIAVRDAAGRARWCMGVTEDVTELREAEEALRTSQRELEEANRKLAENLAELKRSRATSARTLASYQQRALQMEIIRQQNEDLDRLAQDLARAKKIEEERAREIESAARLKSEFLANFSHEIRTPLNGILGYCELLMREEGSRLTPHGRRDLAVIKTNAKTLLALINDILDLSKIEAGHVEVVKTEVDLHALVDECAATVREYLQGKDVTLTSNVAPDVVAVRTDGLKLRQILLNLLSNAAKFTDAGEIVVDAQREGDVLRISVEDTGAGIPADQVPFVFEKFRQVDGSSTRKVGGTGLGLAIVRELSRVLGGTVEVSSVLGRGSVFTVKLRGVFSEAPATESARPRTDRSESSAGRTVLVVDDDPLIHQLLRTQLEREGMKVLHAHDGVEALSMARHHRPALIVVDVYLPKLDGWAVLTELKSDPALAGVPVVLISVEDARARGMSVGAQEFLLKPFEPDHLVTVVQRVLSPGAGEVLVVDDDSAIRMLMVRHLRRVGFATAETSTGTEALARIRVTRPALVVLDLSLGDLEGLEVLRRLRAVDVVMPVVVLTGRNLSEGERALLTEYKAAVVTKGDDAADRLVAEARRLLLSQRTDAPARLPRVLYVEDSAQNRDVVRRYLRGTYDVIEAEDGEHGVERATRDQPDLILMDLSLPRMDGWEATRRIKAAKGTSAIPIVALTAHASREDQARARAAGCDGYLTKPVERDTLITTIRQFLAARAATAAAS